MGRTATAATAKKEERDTEAMLVFCAALREALTVGEAAAQAGIDRATAYRWREADEGFATAWEDALDAGTEVLEAEAKHRAVHGVEEPIVYQGQLTPVWERDGNGEIVMAERHVPNPASTPQNPLPDIIERVPKQLVIDGKPQWLTVRKPSDTLMIFLLKARRPEVYRERLSMEHTGKGGKDLPAPQLMPTFNVTVKA